MATTTDIAIVGGGIVGCAIAHALTGHGVTSVMVVDHGPLGGGATGLCPGGIRQQFEGEADCLLARRSVRFYERINEILTPELPFSFERSGYLFLADSEGALSRFRQNVARQNRLGIPSRILDPHDVRALVPRLRLEGVRGAAFCHEDGFLEDCQGVSVALFRRARERGARLHHDEVLELGSHRGLWRIKTRQAVIDAGHVIVAAGPDSTALLRSAGVEVPIRRERRRLAFTTPYPERVMAPLVVAPERNVAGKQLGSGVLYLGWLAETPEADDLQFVEETIRAGMTLLPPLADVPVRRVLTGWYDTTPDRRPILGRIPERPGLLLAAGFSGHGFMIAPAVGEIMSSAVTGETCDLPASVFSVDRFRAFTSTEGLVI